MNTSTITQTLGKKFLTRIVAFVLLAITAPSLDAQDLECVNFPATLLTTSWTGGEAYVNIQAITFNPVPANVSDPLFLLDVEYNLVLTNTETGESEVYGSFVGPSSDMFKTQMGPLAEAGTAYSLSIETIGLEGNCESSVVSFEAPDYHGLVTPGGAVVTDDDIAIVGGAKNLVNAVIAFEEKNEKAGFDLMKNNRTFTANDSDLVESLMYATEDVIRPTNRKVSFEVYPNPTTDFISVEANEESALARVLVFDISGNLMINQVAEAGATINVDLLDLQLGNYMVSFIDDSNDIIDQQQIVKR